MDEFEKTYKKFDNYYKEKPQTSFGKSVILPFASGILGSALVIGICFGIPQIKDKLFKDSAFGIMINSTPTISTSNKENSEISTNSLISLASYSEATTAIAKKVQPSIVGIKVEYTVNSLFGGASNATASGSGIIVTENGYILTNNHVISTASADGFYQLSEATSLRVYLYNDNTPYTATVVGTDELTDLAVIKIDKTGLTPAELGNSDSVEVGAFAMAIGNPLGFESSVTTGTVSAVNREIKDSDGRKFVLIQTDAAINAGNSGGALVNSYGQVVGINTLKLSGDDIEGIGFAIPINSTTDVYNQLIQYNKVKRPYIGIGGIDIDKQKADYYNLPIGVYVKTVDDFSAAQKAGIKPGDVIIAINDKEITTMEELNEIKYTHSIGDTVTLKIDRNNEKMDIELKLEEQP